MGAISFQGQEITVLRVSEVFWFQNKHFILGDNNLEVLLIRNSLGI